MFLPIGDRPNPPGRPFVTWTLIALNVLVYLVVTLPASAQVPDFDDPAFREYLRFLVELTGLDPRLLVGEIDGYDLIVYEWAFRPVEPRLETMFTSMFLHGGFMHLFGNMLFLWIYGDNVEHRLGRLGYLAAYLGTGLAATGVHYLFDMDSPIPTVGASGAISGVLGLYFVFFPRNLVRVFVFFFPFLMRAIDLPARLVLGIYIVIDNLLPVLVTDGSDGVARGAHIGGFLAGLGIAWSAGFLERTRPRVDETIRPRTTGRPSDDRAAVVTRLLQSGRPAEAAQAYFTSEPTIDRLLHPEVSLELARWLEENGHAQAALGVYRRVMHLYSTGETGARAHLGAGRVHLRALGRPTTAWQHFLDTIDLAPDSEAAREARFLIGQVERR